MEEQNQQIQQNQISENQEQNHQQSGIDLSALFKENEPGVYDDDKIAKLAKDYENSKKSAQYFQSQYMKKEGVPDDISLYFKDFTPDSSYAHAMEKDEVKKAKEEVISFIDETAIKLIGVVPYDTEILRAGNVGKLVDEILSNNISYAFENIAYRTLGQARPLFCNIKKLKKLR